jgi:hypothetical protein
MSKRSLEGLEKGRQSRSNKSQRTGRNSNAGGNNDDDENWEGAEDFMEDDGRRRPGGNNPKGFNQFTSYRRQEQMAY